MLGNPPSKPELKKNVNNLLTPVLWYTLAMTAGHTCTISAAVSSSYKTVNKLKASRTSDCLIRPKRFQHCVKQPRPWNILA